MLIHNAEDGGVTKKIHSNESLIERIKSESFIQEFIDRTDFVNRNNELLNAEEFSNNLEVGLVSGTDVIEISYINSGEATAKEVVNAFMEQILREYGTRLYEQREKNPSVIGKMDVISKRLWHLENLIEKALPASKQKLESERQEYTKELKSLYSSREYHNSVIPRSFTQPLQVVRLADSSCSK